MATLHSLKLSAHGPTPNPRKVAIILEILGVPYETYGINLQEQEHKKEPFISKNPNGRLPALEDPNTGVTLFESGAIVEYLVETYDKDGILTYKGDLNKKWLAKSWLHFQMSGQGPYFGQISYFLRFHWEKEVSPSVPERFRREVKRVTGVIDSHLKKSGAPFLLGDKPTYADFVWVPWYLYLDSLVPEWDYKNDHPHFTAWRESLNAHKAVKAVLANPAFN